MEAEARTALLAEGHEQRHIDSVEVVVAHGRRRSPDRIRQPLLHLVQAIAVIDRVQKRRVVPQQGLVLDLQVLGERDEYGLDARAGEVVVEVE